MNNIIVFRGRAASAAITQARATVGKIRGAEQACLPRTPGPILVASWRVSTEHGGLERRWMVDREDLDEGARRNNDNRAAA